MAYVYRWEHPTTGKGPYYMGPALRFGHKYDTKHPGPEEEGLLLTDDRQCGFATLRQARTWFTIAEEKVLFEEGYRFVKRPAIDIQRGKRQVVFRAIQGEVLPYDHRTIKRRIP